MSDSILTATVTALDSTRWKLEISGVHTALTTEYFPWQSQRSPLDSDISNDIYYYPNLLGRTEHASNRNTDWQWYGSIYPGPIAAPLVIMGDPASAKIVAATNWPPKTVSPLYAAQRMVMRYGDAVPVGGSAVYQALIATVTGNAATGNAPWQKALDLYKAWLDSSMGQISYPDWMWQGQGMLNLQLQGYSTTSDVDNSWQSYKGDYPWVLMWGQMSPYPGGSCCGIDLTTNQYYSTLPYMNSRFLPSLPTWTQNTVASGYHAGFYSAPYSEYYSAGPRGYLDTTSGLNWFTNYNAVNHSYGANSYYFDTLAREYWGDPGSIVNLFNTGVIPKDALGEGIVDVYPLPGLVSGALAGGGYCGAPYKTPEAFTVTTFPPFVRYLLNDRQVYWGQSNDDGQFWGTSTPSGCDYATWCANGLCNFGVEHQILLTGARIEMRPGSANEILDAIVAERKRVNWWARKPKYLATLGLNLSTIPASSRIEVSHFLDTNGIDLLAVSNPNLVSGLSVSLNGTVQSIPAQKVAILDVGASVGGDTVAPSSPTNVKATAVSSSGINVTWAASTDNVGVAGYHVYRNGSIAGSVATATTFADTGLTAGTTYSYTVAAYDAAGNTSPLSAAVSAATLTSQAPQLSPVSPASGTGAAQTFTFTYTDTNGAADIKEAFTMINSLLSNGTNTCWFHYVRASNTIQLSYDNTPSTLTWQPALLLGSAVTQQNSQCSINAALVKATTSDKSIVLAVPITFKSAWAGQKSLYLWVSDNSGVSTGYTAEGTWKVGTSATDTTAPSVPGNVRASAVSAYQTSVTWAASTDNVGVAGYKVYRNGYLVASVTSGTSYSEQGLAASTKYSYAIAAYDAAGNVSAQSPAVSVTTLLASNQGPQLAAVSPASGTGTQQTFRFTFSDPNGYADLADGFIMINSSYSNGTNSCWLHYNRPNNVIQLSYDNTPAILSWQPYMTAGTSATEQNSQCSIASAGMNIAASGNGLTVTVPITFKTTWSGIKQVYLYASDKAGLTAGYTSEGSWTVPSE